MQYVTITVTLSPDIQIFRHHTHIQTYTNTSSRQIQEDAWVGKKLKNAKNSYKSEVNAT